MKCPACSNPESSVLETRENGHIRRRRGCKACGHKWTTYEIPLEEYRGLNMVKTALARAGYRK